jgi:hypothetical protein
MTQELNLETKPQEDWMTKKWRPMMAIMYMVVCLCDFTAFPVLWTLVQFYETEAINDAFRQWQPITLGGGGLFHVAMGAVLGVSAYGRSQEKLAGANMATAGLPAAPQPQAQPQPQIVTTPGFNGTSAAETTTAVRLGFNGKLAPPQSPQPLQ